MTRSWFKMLKSSALPALALGAVMALTSPMSAAPRGGGGHGGFGGGGHAAVGHGFSGGGARGFAGGGARGFAGGGERGFVGHGPAVVNRGNQVYRGGGYYGGYRGGYWGGPAIGLGFGAGVGPGYYSNGCGYYDSWGRWIPTVCAVPYGYGYGY